MQRVEAPVALAVERPPARQQDRKARRHGHAEEDHPPDARQAPEDAVENLAAQTLDDAEVAVDPGQGVALAPVELPGVDQQQRAAQQRQQDHASEDAPRQAVGAPQVEQDEKVEERRERHETGGLGHPGAMNDAEGPEIAHLHRADEAQRQEDRRQQPQQIEGMDVRLRGRHPVGRAESERHGRENAGDRAHRLRVLARLHAQSGLQVVAIQHQPHERCRHEIHQAHAQRADHRAERVDDQREARTARNDRQPDQLAPHHMPDDQVRLRARQAQQRLRGFARQDAPGQRRQIDDQGDDRDGQGDQIVESSESGCLRRLHSGSVGCTGCSLLTAHFQNLLVNR